MVATSYWRWLEEFPAYQSSLETSKVKPIYSSVGSGQGRTDFFGGYSLFGATDSDISAAQLTYFLPDFTGSSSSVNITKIINPQTPQHLGNLMFPGISGALAIVYNVQGLNGILAFNATVLGDIFCGKVLMWNDTSIKELNPTISLPGIPINVAGRGDSSGSTNVFTTYLSKYSPTFKKKIGVSSQPAWPPDFIKRNSAIDLMYVCETLQNSITYVPLEAVIEAKSTVVNVAGIYNKNKNIIYPSVDTVAEALVTSTPSEFRRHQYFQPIDANGTYAYPISLMSFVLMREHNFYFTKGNETECDRVKEAVLFWYFAFTEPSASSILASNGWVPISGQLLQFNLQALGMITCNKVNVMETIKQELSRHEFYGEHVKEYILDTGLFFWDIVSSSFAASPIGSSFYVIYFAAVLLAALIPFSINIMSYQYEKMKEDEEDEKERKENALEAGEDEDTTKQNSETKVIDTGKEPIHRAKRTSQNLMGVVTIFITTFQLVYLCLHRSVVIDPSSILMTIISFCGLIIDDSRYYAVLMIAAIIWVACLQYAVIVHPFMMKHHPFVVAKMTGFHSFLALYLPNYVAIFYNPSVELFAKAFDCKLSPTTNRYFNSYDPTSLTCFYQGHWVMVVLSLVYTTSFVFSVVRYSKILKSLRKNFDLKDKAWKTYIGSIIKCIIIVLFFNVPASAFLILTAILLTGLSLVIWFWRPNYYSWFDHLRSASYMFAAFVAMTLFVLELAISKDQYDSRKSIRGILVIAIFSCLCVFTAVGVFFALRQFETELSAEEKEKQKDEIAQFFAAFIDESNEELPRESVASSGSNPQAADVQTNAMPPLPLSNQLGSQKFGGATMSKFSLAGQSSKLLPIIQKAKVAGLISTPDAITLTKAIKNDDPLVSVLFKRCNRDFDMFTQLLHLQVIQCFEERFTVDNDGQSRVRHSKVSMAPPNPRKFSQKAPSIHSPPLKEAAIMEEDE
ncbi:Phosphate-binding protein PstS 1 [Rhizoclosmatium sp. JEL0117]|nr:Phosphate-binding protein PstS 1 [Rhizoclosmatium sp. JEL0117]